MDESGSSWWFSADRKWRRGTPPPGWRQASDRRWHPPAAMSNGQQGRAAPADPFDSSESGEVAGLAGTMVLAPTAAIAAVPPDDVPPQPGAPTPQHLGARAAAASGHREWSSRARMVLLVVVALVVLGAVGVATALADDASGVGSDRAAAVQTTVGVSPPATPGPVTPEGSESGTPSSTAGPVNSPPAGSAPSTTASPSTTGSTSSTTEPPPSPEPPATDLFAACTDAQLGLLERGNHPQSWYIERLDRDGDGIPCE
jgi:hypothetical protein